MIHLLPTRPRWSYGAQMALNAAETGSASVGDVQWAAAQLANADDDSAAAWLAPWSALADRWERRAEETKDPATRAAASWRAATYLFTAERLIPPGHEAKESVYERARALADAAYPGIRPRAGAVTVPFGDGSLSGLYATPDGWDPTQPTVICLGGLDTTKELSYSMIGVDVVRSGFACLMLEGPGQGGTLRDHGLTLRFDAEAWVGAAIDHLRALGTTGPIALVGMSMGGYLAARALACEPRLDVGVVWGAVWDYHAIWARRLGPQGFISADERAHLHWILGVDSDDAALEVLAPFQLAPVAGATTAPVLVVHGADDRAVALDDARSLFDALGSSDKELVVFDEADFGSEHVQIDNLAHGTHVVVSWLQSRLAGAPT